MVKRLLRDVVRFQAQALAEVRRHGFDSLADAAAWVEEEQQRRADAEAHRASVRRFAAVSESRAIPRSHEWSRQAHGAGKETAA